MQTTPRGLTAPTGPEPPPIAVEPLAWDSAHFGLDVARIAWECGDAERLAAALALAGARGFSLVYVFAAPESPIPDEVLRRFDGLKADDRVVYETTLEGGTPAASLPQGPTIHEAPGGEPSPALVELAVEAGAYSRFRTDSRIPAEAFRRLYEIWIARSCRGEAADVVLTAELDDAPGEPSGLVTLAVRGDEATIGLVAVGARARRRGVGRALMQAAHAWLRRRGVRRVRVATQEANAPACALYEACGYRPASRETIYHFRPRSAVVA